MAVRRARAFLSALKTRARRARLKKEAIIMGARRQALTALRAFRDRRYEYKKLTKQWKKAGAKAAGAGDAAARKVAWRRIY